MALTARLLFAAALLLSYTECVLNVGALGEVVPALREGGHALLTAGLVLGGIVHAVGVVGWARSPASTRAVVAALAPIVLAAILERLLSPSGVHHGKLLPTVALGAWAWGLRGVPSGALWRAREAACGVVGAIYGLAAGAKVVGAGARWFDPDYLGLLMIERSVGAVAPLAAVRLWIAGHPPVVTALAASALVIEAAGVLFLWPRWRRPVAIAIVGLHAGIAIGMGYVYVTWVLAVVALAWDAPAGGAPA